MINKRSDNIRLFVDAMDSILRQNEQVDGRGQKRLVQDLIKIENKFKRTLLSTAHGPKLYHKFMDFILKVGESEPDELKTNYVPDSKEDMLAFQEEISQENGNILRARVYFRERQNMFSKYIATAFHKKRSNMLHKFRINYEFARWVMDNYHGPKKRELRKLYQSILDTRKILCENNLPLVLHSVKIFWCKIPETSLEYEDLVNDASEGLLTAIDKFVPPYRHVFRSTGIGRMTLNMSTDHSSTMLKLSPKDKRILYRARKAKSILKNPADGDILKYVQESFPNVTQPYLTELLAATSVSDIDGKTDDSYPLSEKLSDVRTPVDEQVIGGQLRDKTYGAFFTLYIRERKIVRLKLGIDEFEDTEL